jgi:Rho GDP-dissociation inhibitor
MKIVVVFTRKVIVKSLSLVVEDRDDVVIDLTEELATIKTKSFTIKEGVKFRIKINFVVQREIVHGLKYVQKTYRYKSSGYIESLFLL